MRRVLGAVFAQRDYQWVARREPLRWIKQLWFRFLDWIDSFSHTHPIGYNALLVVLTIALLLLLAHISYNCNCVACTSISRINNHLVILIKAVLRILLRKTFNCTECNYKNHQLFHLCSHIN